jgi:hypothetical protein
VKEAFFKSVTSQQIVSGSRRTDTGPRSSDPRDSYTIQYPGFRLVSSRM